MSTIEEHHSALELNMLTLTAPGGQLEETGQAGGAPLSADPWLTATPTGHRVTAAGQRAVRVTVTGDTAGTRLQAEIPLLRSHRVITGHSHTGRNTPPEVTQGHHRSLSHGPKYPS